MHNFRKINQLISHYLFLHLPLQFNLFIIIRKANKSADVDHDEADKETRRRKRITKVRNAMTKVKEKLKRDSSSSSSSFESDDSLTSDELSDLQGPKDYLTCSNESSIKG